MSNSAKIIQFPANKVVRDRKKLPDTLTELEEVIAAKKREYLDSISLKLMAMVYDKLPEFGINEFDEDLIDRDLPFVGMAIKAALYRQQGIWHTLQDASDFFAAQPDLNRMMITRPVPEDDTPPLQFA